MKLHTILGSACVALSLFSSGAAHATPAAKPGLTAPLSAPVTAKKLAIVTQKVRALAAAGRTPVAVFDIDDTLLHNGRFTPKPLVNTAEPGAVSYVKSLRAAGATIVYLTGRKASQETKTVAALKEAGLPTGGTTKLMLNPSSKMSSVDWKRSATPAIAKLGKTVAVFDNEFENVRMFRLAYPRSSIFRLATSSNRPDPGGKGSIYVIKDFL
ncbi:MAG: HAD family acid phosphatase [Polyangia bacterium]